MYFRRGTRWGDYNPGHIFSFVNLNSPAFALAAAPLIHPQVVLSVGRFSHFR
ncbi:hypothetical protein GCM10027018_24960 [Paenibacillus thermoaerophilus]